MVQKNTQTGASRLFGHGMVLSLFLLAPVLQGCLATRDWVNEQLNPLGQRLSDNETKLGQTGGRVEQVEGRVSGVEGKVSDLDGKIGQVDAKAEKALNTFGNLRLQRKLVLSMKEGAQFASNSAAFSDQTKREIDGFLSDLKNDLKESDSAVFLVAGHTDNTGPDDFNYELGTKRASSVARYLITQKAIDPTRVVTVSYGEAAPLEDNKTRQGRQKNRRVEILVYKEGITSVADAAGEQTARAMKDPAPR
jgi:outer membrane protein OmpA-like peptidoglycan-associated protein